VRSVILFEQLPATDYADRDENRKTENSKNENISSFSFPPQSISAPSFLFQLLALFRLPGYAPRRRVRPTSCFRQTAVTPFFTNRTFGASACRGILTWLPLGVGNRGLMWMFDKARLLALVDAQLPPRPVRKPVGASH
jgi:hypothetical protein